MIDLTEEQSQELQRPEPLVRDPRTNETYVFVRREVYKQLAGLMDDEAALSRREVSLLVERVMREYDEGNPSLHLYQND